MDKISCDFCIVGGGAAGCAAAYIASKLGLRTVLVEKNNYLGGLMTGGLVVPMMKTDSSGLNTEFFDNLINHAKKYNAQATYFDSNKGWLNPTVLKIMLDKMLIDSGAKILFNLEPKELKISDSKIESIEFESNLLSLHIESKYYLDSTGDSKIFKLANLKFFENEEKKQPSSLRFFMENVDIEKLKNFLINHDSDRNVTNFTKTKDGIHLTSAYTWDNRSWNLKPIFDKAVKNGQLTEFDTCYFQIFTVAGQNSAIAFNCPRLRDFKQDDPIDYSNALIEARQAIWRISNFMKKNFEGFENAYISQIADMTGFRETNKIISKHNLTFDCIMDSKPTSDAILAGDYPFDVHSNKKDDSVLETTKKYYATIDSLISADILNLYAAGRNLGADKLVQGALRIQASCMSMGEAVARHVKSII